MGHLLHLVCGVTSLEVRAKSPTLDGLCQNYSWLAVLLCCSFISSEEFAVIMSAALKSPNLLIAPVGNQCCGARIATKEVLANICATFGFKGLIITVGGAVHQINKCAIAIVSKKFIPLAAPDNLDHIPTCTTED